MKNQILISLSLILLFVGCSATNYVYINRIAKILPNDASTWNIDDCNKILKFYTSDNSTNQIFKSSPVNQKVIIKALLLNKTSIKAMARKEVIEKRLEPKEYYIILDNYLQEFTSFKYNFLTGKIVVADTNFTEGYSFKIYFENISEPYQPIFLEDGYSYFFLENMKGEFSRVTKVTGLFVEDYFQLDGYLDAIITFSPFSTTGKLLFEEKDLNESYMLIFNGLQSDPIEIKWILE